MDHHGPAIRPSGNSSPSAPWRSSPSPRRCRSLALPRPRRRRNRPERPGRSRRSPRPTGTTTASARAALQVPRRLGLVPGRCGRRGPPAARRGTRSWAWAPAPNSETRRRCLVRLWAVATEQRTRGPRGDAQAAPEGRPIVERRGPRRGKRERHPGASGARAQPELRPNNAPMGPERWFRGKIV